MAATTPAAATTSTEGANGAAERSAAESATAVICYRWSAKLWTKCTAREEEIQVTATSDA